MKWLLCRFGGIGDSMALTPVALNLRKKHSDISIDIAVRGSEIASLLSNIKIDGNKLFNKVIPIQRMPDPVMGMNCVKTVGGFETLEKRKEKYDVVIDYINSIESNSMHGQYGERYGAWMETQNSNYQNWIDIMLSWANIDPSTCEEKGLIYQVEDSERKVAIESLKDMPRPLIGISMFASSRARSYLDVNPLMTEVLSEIPTATLIVWDGASWVAIRDGGQIVIKEKPTMRESSALVEQFDCFVSADSGYSHIAEAMGVETVSIYSTVPAWTRNKYYKHSNDLQVEIECSPCFTLHEHCPVNRKRAMESLSAREREILQLSNQNVPPQIASQKMATTPDKLIQEHQGIMQKIEGISSVVPDCIASVSPYMIVERVKEALDGKGL